MKVRLELRGKGAILTMDWKERANALSPDMARMLVDAVDEAIGNGARALALTGAGRAFCSGGQLDDPLPDDAGAILEETINPLLLKLSMLEVPLITALNGPAIGAGASLALAGDVVIAARSAWLSFGFARVGLSCDGGASWLLPRAVGWHRAMEMMMLGEQVPAHQAHDWGLVTRLVDHEALPDETFAMLDRLANGPTQSYSLIRNLARRALGSSFSEALDAERTGQRRAGLTADFREGAAAFRERREPFFHGN